jgi:hypothetical protein
MDRPNLEAIEGGLPTVPDYVLDSVANNTTGFNWSILLWILVGIAVVGLFFLFRMMVIRRKPSGINSYFNELYKQGVEFIDKKDFENAKMTYNKMKSMAEKDNDKEMRDRVINLYKYYENKIKNDKV